MTPLDREIRRIAAELESFPFVSRTWNWLDGPLDGNAAGGHATIVAGSGGAAVYHDILEHGGHGTRGKVRQVVDRIIVGSALRSAQERETAEAIKQVAHLRRRGSFRVSSPWLPPDAGSYYRASGEPQARRSAPRRGSTPAGKAGAKVAGYLRVHVRKPYVRPETIQSLVDEARLAWRLALQEVADALPT